MAQYAYVVARNNRAGIQLEIDKAQDEGGGLVFLPRGTYALDGPIRLKSNVHLTGMGERTVLQVDPALGDAAFDVNVIELDPGGEATPRNIEVSRLSILGPSADADVTRGAASDFKKGCGIVATQTEVFNVVIRACRIERIGGCGVLFFTQRPDHLMADIVIEDCRMVQNRRPDDPHAASAYKDIYCYGARFENVRIENNSCTFTPNASSRYGNDSGMAFVGNGHGGYVRHTRLVGNVCSGHRRHGVTTNYGRMAADGVFVSHNRCEDNGWVGIYVNTDFTYTQEGRVVITGNICAYNGCGGIHETGRPDATIRGGIVLNGAYHTVVSNNICTDNGDPGPAFKAHGFAADADAVHAAGIRVRGNEDIVDGNLVKGNRGDGIVLWPGQVGRLSITNNRAVQNRKNGIMIAGAPDETTEQVVVTGNVCAENRENGVRSERTDGALITANQIDRNGSTGIELERTVKRARVEGNLIEVRAGQRALRDRSKESP